WTAGCGPAGSAGRRSGGRGPPPRPGRVAGSAGAARRKGYRSWRYCRRPRVHPRGAAGMCRGRDGAPPGRAGRAAVRMRCEGAIMAFVVTQPCAGCKYTDCVAVCPTDCFHEGEQMLYIDPNDCLDCEACVPECPVEAIYHETRVPAPWQEYIALNAEGARRYPLITQKKER